MEEEEILDHERKYVKPTPIWPYVLLGGLAAGTVKIVFTIMAPYSSFSVKLILSILLAMIMMNTTLNFYYQKKNSAKDVRTGVLICFGVYVVMQALLRITLYILDRDTMEFYDDWMIDVALSLAGGTLLSVLVTILSRKAD